MASSKEDREAVAAFVRELYELGGFTSWGEFARESGFLPSSMSDWSRGENAPSGPTLVRLIHTATDRAPLALREAAEKTSPLRQVRRHLEAIGEAVAATRDDTARALESVAEGIARIEDRLSGEGGQARGRR